MQTFKETVFYSLILQFMKRKYLRAKEAPFMTKEPHKAVMKRSRLRNKFLKIRMKLTETTIKFREIIVKNSLKLQRNSTSTILTLLK